MSGKDSRDGSPLELTVQEEPSFLQAFIEPLRVLSGLAIGLPLYVKGYEALRGDTSDHSDQPVMSPTILLVGLPLVTLGLALFAVGLRDGLMPLGDLIGHTLMVEKRQKVPMVGFLLGLLLTFGEPAIGALVEIAYEAWEFPTIQGLLGQYQLLTVGAIGCGVGLASALGCWRLSRASVSGIERPARPLWQLITPMVALCLSATFVTPKPAQGLAWDAGAVTTGPITVPVVLALGSGLVRDGTGTAFGIVTFASLFPVMSICASCLGIKAFEGMFHVHDASALRPPKEEAAEELFEVAREEAILTAMSFVPLAFGLLSVLAYLQVPCEVLRRRPLPLGIAKVLLGLYCFFVGIKVGVLPMGRNGGSRLVAGVISSSGEVHRGALCGILLFGFLTIAVCQMIEPDLLVLGGQAQQMSQGKVRKLVLVGVVAVGTGIGTVMGIIKVVFNLAILPILIPAYAAALLLTYKQDDFVVGIAWDCAGTTTGSITVPLILALGLGVAERLAAINADNASFDSLGPLGILGCASVFPIFTVLLVYRGTTVEDASSLDVPDVPSTVSHMVSECDHEQKKPLATVMVAA